MGYSQLDIFDQIKKDKPSYGTYKSRYAESNIQKSLFRWAHLNKGKWPELQALYAIPNGAHVSDKNRIRLVYEGMRKGMPDVHFPVPKGPYASLYLEIKTKEGRVSIDQQNRMQLLASLGNLCVVARGLYECIGAVEDYLAL